jgi:hypothetical protein
MAWNVNTDLIKGNDLNLYLVELGDEAMTSGKVSTAKVIAYSTSCSFEISSDSIDVTSKLSCRWNANVQGNASYTLSSDALYCLQSSASANGAYTVDDLFEAMCEGDNVGWVLAKDASEVCGTISGPDTTGICYWGEAAITSLSITGGNNEIASSSIQLTGSGRPYRYGE